MGNKWENTFSYLKKCKEAKIDDVLNQCGKEGVESLTNNTPVNTGLLANSWTYKVLKNSSGYSIVWENSDKEGGYNVALLVQYGHGTGRGGYVQGRDYINPSIQKVFDSMLDKILKEVFN